MHINLNGSFHDDMVDITPDDIYQNFYSTGTLPKTAAISIGEYTDFLNPLLTRGMRLFTLTSGELYPPRQKTALLPPPSLKGYIP